MKKLTKVVLLSSVIVLPVKIGLSTSKESVEGARRKRIEVERVENILVPHHGDQNASDPPPSVPDTKISIKIASLSKDPAPSALRYGVSEVAPAKEESDHAPALASAESPGREAPPPDEMDIATKILTFEVENPQPSSDSMASDLVLTIRTSEPPAANILIAGPLMELSLGPVPVATLAPTTAASQILDERSAPAQNILVSSSNEPRPSTAAAASTVSELPVQEPPPATSQSESQPELKKVRVRLTFYSGKDDPWGSRVAWSKVRRAKRGRTAAADPTIFPYGTWIDVPGFGKLRVEDTGTAVKTRKASGGMHPVIDIYIGDEEEVLRLAGATPDYVEITLL